MSSRDIVDIAYERQVERRDNGWRLDVLDWDVFQWNLTPEQRVAYTARMLAYWDRLQTARDRAEQRRIARCWWGFIALAILGAAVVAGVVGS